MFHPLPDAHSLDACSVADHLQVDPGNGLSLGEVNRRIALHGPNRLRPPQRRSALSLLRHQFKSIIVWLLAAAATLSFFMGDIPEGAAIICVLLVNGTIGFMTELRAARSMEALLRVADVRTRVRRAGQTRLVDAQSLVPGDVVLLDAGDIVTADLRLSQASNLHCDESVLTGESAPVLKTVHPVPEETAIADRSSLAYKGTAVTLGTGEGLVVATGKTTEIGKISDLAFSATPKVAPLERRLDRLGHRLVWLTLALAIVTIGAGILRGHDAIAMIQTGVALAVAAVPEGLPVVATLCLARGMWRMAERNALITNLSSVETLGATTLIMTDKTGTLTRNRMAVVRYVLSGQTIKVTNHQNGRRFIDSSDQAELDPTPGSPLGWALRLGAICNNASLGGFDEEEDTGDPMEIALLSVAIPDQNHLRETYPKLLEHAFDPDTKMMATVHRDTAPDGAQNILIAVKGAPEAVISSSEFVLTSQGIESLDSARRDAWIKQAADTAGQGLRVLALAMKHSPDKDTSAFDRLVLVGLVGLLDPLRADVPDAIRASHTAGVRIVMLTGDHASTARTIAQDAGIGNGDLDVIEGGEIIGLDPDTVDEETRRKLLETDVFARVAPDTKLALVSIYQQEGHIIAMTGDGVNDAPALRKSDIGIAMGQRGTQVAREAADMVLKDDAFETIIAAMRQGRIIHGNIRKFVIYLMSCNVSEVLVVGLAVGVGLPTPLLPLQILFLNLVTDVFPAFALGLCHGDENVMNRPPRDPAEPIIDRPRWSLIMLLGALITLTTLAAFMSALYLFDLPKDAAVTVAFLTLALAQLWNVFNVRAPDSGLIQNEITRNPYIWGALLLCLGLIGLALSLPAASALLGLPNPGSDALVLAAALSMLPLLLGQVILHYHRNDQDPLAGIAAPSDQKTNRPDGIPSGH